MKFEKSLGTEMQVFIIINKHLFETKRLQAST